MTGTLIWLAGGLALGLMTGLAFGTSGEDEAARYDTLPTEDDEPDFALIVDDDEETTA